MTWIVPGLIVRFIGDDVWDEPSSVLGRMRYVTRNRIGLVLSTVTLAGGSWTLLLLADGTIGWVRSMSVYVGAPGDGGEA